jgi:eukaryotic-like serine/threonine-protein kinase
MMELFNNRYEIQEKLGEGGMGAVYRAVDRLTGETVALKFVLNSLQALTADDVTEDQNFQISLAREFKMLASLRHPNIISVLDYGFGTFNNTTQPYVAMEILPQAQSFVQYGDTLQSVESKIVLSLGLLQALAYLHRRNILHRDLKPDNVLVTAEHQLKVLDFGLAIEQGAEGTFAGTFLYMAPELLSGGDPSVASDLYAVGVMVYELLTGRNPFSRDAAWQTINAVMYDEPDLSEVHQLATRRMSAIKTTRLHKPDELLDKTVVANDNMLVKPLSDHPEAYTIEGTALPDILARLLAKQPAYRYQSAEAVIQAFCAAVALPLPEETTAIRESFLQGATFIGRQEELAQLTQGLRSILDDKRGTTWLIAGESGIGKSRLLEEMRIQAMVRGALVIRGGVTEEVSAPYQLWREPLRRLLLTTEVSDLDASILKDLVPDIETLLRRGVPDAVKVDSAAYQQRLHGTIASLFGRQTTPLVVLLEDIHRATGETLELLKVIARLVDKLPVMLVATYCIDDHPALHQQLAEMKLLKLQRLSPDEVALLSKSMLGAVGERADVIDLLQRETEGNIFFMIEIARALSEEAGSLGDIGTMPLPQSLTAGGIEAVIQQRLQKVLAPYQPLLRLAALAGRQLDLPVLRLLNRDIDIDSWLFHVRSAGVIELREGQWQFAYDRLRETVANAVPESERSSLHLEVAQAMESVHGNRLEHAAALAVQWQRANDVEKEFIYTRRAASYALKVSVFADAVTHLTHALGLVRTIDADAAVRDQDEADILVNLGETLYYSGDYSTAMSRLEASLRLYRSLNDERGIAQALNALSDTRWRLGEYPEAVTAGEEALKLSRTNDDQGSIARALNRLGMILVEQGSYEEAALRLNESAEVAKSLNAPGLIVSPINNLALVAFAQGDYDSAEKYLKETLDLSRKSGERYKTAAILANLGGVAGSREAFSEAMDYFKESLKISQSIGYRHGIAFALKNLGILAEMQGDYTTAEGYLKEGLELSQAIGERQSSAMTLISLGEVAHLQEHTLMALYYYQQGLQLAKEIDALPIMMDALVGIAKLVDNPKNALQLLSFVTHHPATVEETRRLAEPVIEEIRLALPMEETQAALTTGLALSLEQAIEKAMET